MDYSTKSSYPRNNRYRKKQSSEWGTILLFYVLPFLVVNAIIFFCVTTRPKIEVTIADTNDYLSTEVTVAIKSWFPTKDLQISMAGEELEVEKGKKRTYTMTVSKNGVVEVLVTNINGMSATEFGHVNILDDNPPFLEKANIADGVVTLTVSDSQSGVNFDSIYAENSAGERLAPLAVDRSTATLSFEMDPAGLHVYAQDKAGNEVLGNFTSHKVGDEERLEGGVEEPAEGEAGEAETTAQETQEQTNSTAASDITIQ